MSNIGQLEIRRIGQPKSLVQDAYHTVHAMGWSWLLLCFFTYFLGLNIFFAFLYSLGGDCLSADNLKFTDYFFFSVQSFSTIGYGALSPTTLYSNILVTGEAFLGMLSTALMTGIVFAKFSLPSSRVLFTNKALLCKRNGKDSLILRLANGRGNGIVSAKLQATLILDGVTAEGEPIRGLLPLRLKHDTTPILSLTLTLTHHIEEDSPLYGLTLQDLQDKKALLIVTVTGLDNLIGQSVHAQHFYQSGDFVKGKRFLDTLSSKKKSNGEVVYTLDYTNFHEYEV